LGQSSPAKNSSHWIAQSSVDCTRYLQRDPGKGVAKILGPVSAAEVAKVEKYVPLPINSS